MLLIFNFIVLFDKICDLLDIYYINIKIYGWIYWCLNMFLLN